MRRLEAISGKTVGSQKLWMGQTHVAPSTSSGDHHHGEAETAIYVVSGHPVFVFADGPDEKRIETEPGDYVFVPPVRARTARRTRPADEEAVVDDRPQHPGRHRRQHGRPVGTGRADPRPHRRRPVSRR